MTANEVSSEGRKQGADPGIRLRMLDAARDVVYERGDAVSVREIASRAGISLSTFYVYFESKEALLRQVQIRAVKDHLAAVDAVFADGREADFGLLCAAFRVHVLQQMSNAREARILRMGIGDQSHELRREIRSHAKEAEERFQSVARQLAEKGEIASSNVRIKIRMLLSAGNDVRDWFKPEGGMSANAIADIYVDMCRAALKG